MKLKIKVKRINKNLPIPKVINKGEWVDLRNSVTTIFDAPHVGRLHNSKNGESSRDIGFASTLLKLGIAMELPEGFEALVLPRSSTYKNFGIILANSMGVIDNSYKGDKDEWMFNAIALRNTTIKEGDRICQFRIQLSQKATLWQKIKWLFSSGIELVEVGKLGNNNRHGIGSTGTN